MLTTELKICPACGQSLKHHYQYCIRCGQPYPLEDDPLPDAPLHFPPVAGPVVGSPPGLSAAPSTPPPAEPVQLRPAAGPVVGMPPDLSSLPSIPGVSTRPRVAPPLAPERGKAQPEVEAEPKKEVDIWGSWLFSLLTGAYAVATVAVANVLLAVLSFAMTGAYDWVGGGFWFFVFALVILVGLFSIGAPVLILLGIVGAVVGGIAGAISGIGIGLVCVLAYVAGSLFKPLRPVLMYPAAAGLAVFLYSQLSTYRDLLHELSYLTWIDTLNFALFGIAGLVVAWYFLTPPVEVSPEEGEENWEATKSVLGAPWRLFRRVGSFANEAYEKEQHDYTFREALGMKAPPVSGDEYMKAFLDGDKKTVRRAEEQLKEQQRELERKMRG